MILNSFEYLIGMCTQLFSCLLKRDYIRYFYFFEKCLHDQKLRFLKSIILWKKHYPDYLLKREHPYHILMHHLENIHDIIMDCAQLRHRIEETSMLEICEQTLLNIICYIVNVLQAVKQYFIDRTIPIEIDTLLSAITQLQDDCERVLQVVSPQAIIFFLFTDRLFALYQQLVLLKDHVLTLSK